MRLFFGICAVVFLGLGIVCILGDYQYMAMTLLVFWMPDALLAAYVIPRLTKWETIPLVLVGLFVFLLAIVTEFLAFQFDLWDYSESMDLLLPWRLGTIPIEEFSFWFSASAQILLLYASVRTYLIAKGFRKGAMYAYWKAGRQARAKRKPVAVPYIRPAAAGLSIFMFPVFLVSKVWGMIRKGKIRPARVLKGDKFFHYLRGAWFPGWTMAVLVFLVFGILLFRNAIKKFHGLAFVFCFLFNNIVYLLVEYNSISRGHWGFNEARLSGLRVGVLPVEELIFYLCVFLITIPLLESCQDLIIRVYGSMDDKRRSEKELGLGSQDSLLKIRMLVDKTLEVKS